MKYISTRGQSEPLSFTDVLLSGTAPDGGLYIPDHWPELDYDLLNHMAGMSYVEIATQVITPFIDGTIDSKTLTAILKHTYEGKDFSHTAITPMAQLGPNSWLLELFHGPTLSFKDYALQCLGRLFDHVLEQQGKRITIIGATSGDTGSAAIEACKGLQNVDIFILHPQGKTSDIQRKQMTTVDAPNVHNIALQGTFDDCQAIVKTMFADQKLREELNLSAINSINWARIMMQIVYYVAAAVSLGAPKRSVSFAVPTGNFGNVYAAWAARRMGLPIHRLVIGTNRNDIITRFFDSGEMKIGDVTPTISPSMDIQISSNFERYLCDLLGRDHKKLTALMTEFSEKKSFKIDPDLMRQTRRDFRAFRCDDAQTSQVMKECLKRTGMIIDPHTTVGLKAASQIMAQDDPSVPMIVLACAHPSKFPEAVEKATGQKPLTPKRLEQIMDKPEFVTGLPNDPDKVADFIKDNVSH